MYYLSIDPGATGAVAAFDDLDLLGVFDIPFVTVGKNKIMDSDTLESMISDVIPLDRSSLDKVFIEQVGSRTGQGVKSMFSFGTRFGEVCSWALTFTRDIVFLTPQSWKSSAGLIGTDKIESAKRAAKIYPDQENFFLEKNNRCKAGVKYYDGRADAVLIGLIGFKMAGDMK